VWILPGKKKEIVACLKLPICVRCKETVCQSKTSISQMIFVGLDDCFLGFTIPSLYTTLPYEAIKCRDSQFVVDFLNKRLSSQYPFIGHVRKQKWSPNKMTVLVQSGCISVESISRLEQTIYIKRTKMHN
jgi:hypothetical protein